MRKHKLNYKEGDTIGVCTFIKDLPHKGKHRFCMCKCPCGKIYEVFLFVVKEGTTCCGFYRKPPKLGFRKDSHPLYSVWCDMKRRCNKENYKHYHNYGGRGISVCDEWNNFENFYYFGISNGWEKGLEIDRINNNGNYSPDNCRFVTRKVNDNNRRTCVLLEINGVKKTKSEWADFLSIPYSTLISRINRGYLGEDLLLPYKKYKKRNSPPFTGLV